jgi:heme exporter protein CcmD
MSSHFGFIFLSYALGTLILGWTAISPILKKRRLLAQLERLHRDQQHKEEL